MEKEKTNMKIFWEIKFHVSDVVQVQTLAVYLDSNEHKNSS